MSSTGALEAQPHRHALADLDAAIDHAERTRDRCRLDLQDAAEAGKSTAHAEAVLAQAEQHLAQLRKDREALLAGGPS
jgi:hypothetical protein